MGLPLQVLIVEDSDADAQLIMHWLRRGGFEPIVERVDTIAALRTALAGQKWDIIVSDYYIPPFNGLEALALWKESGLNIPFIVVSGTMGEDVAVECMKAGAIDYLMKDRLARLGSAVTRALEQEKLLEEKRLAEQEIESLAKFPSEDIGPVLRFARDGRLLYANPASADLLRMWDCEVGDRPPHEIQLIAYQSLVIPMRQEIEVGHGDTIDALMFLPIVDKDYVNVYGRDITERKRAEVALRESEERFSKAFYQSPIGIALTDLSDLTIWDVNEALLKTMGLTREQMIGHNALKLDFQVDSQVRAEIKQEVLEFGLFRDKEVQVRLPGGESRHVLGSGSLINLGGKPHILALVEDITERKRAEEALREAEAKYRTLVEQIPAITYIAALDEFSRANYVSPQIGALGFTSDEWVTGLWVEQLHPDDSERVLAEVRRSQAALAPFISEYRLLTRDGQVRWYHDEGVVVRDPQGVPQFLQGIMLDITERKRAEEKIERQLQHLNALRGIDVAISSSFDMRVTLDIVLQQVLTQSGVDAAAILVLDPHRQTMEYEASRGFRSNALQHAQLALGEGYASHAVRERQTIHRPRLLEAGDEFAEVLQLAKEEFVDYYGMPLIVKDEVKGVLEIYHRSLLNPDLESLGFLETLAGQAAIALDNAQLFEGLQRLNARLEQRVVERTSELNQTNAELEHANRGKDEFLASMSHELRTPLNVILGLSETLLEQLRGPLTEPQEKALHLISSSGQHLLGLINDILDVSKLEATKLQIHPDVISVSEVCESSLNFVRELALHKSISLDYWNSEAIKSVYADPKRLKQILVNLLNNAVKFTPEKGNVSLQVEVSEERDQIQFVITDTGIGISPEDLQKLFKPFTQLDSSLGRQYTGTGLGLVLVYKFTELHGGSVHVESAVGKGSRFTIALPWSETPSPNLDQNETVSAPVKIEQEESISPRQALGLVLLVEDTESNILAVSDYLQDHGFPVALAHNGFEALDQAEKLSPSLILMDIQMPGMDGLEAIRHLRANPRFASTPIIALTALAMPGDRERCLEAGGNEYMSKPVSLKRLVKAIHEQLS